MYNIVHQIMVTKSGRITLRQSFSVRIVKVSLMENTDTTFDKLSFLKILKGSYSKQCIIFKLIVLKGMLFQPPLRGDRGSKRLRIWSFETSNHMNLSFQNSVTNVHFNAKFISQK